MGKNWYKKGSLAELALHYKKSKKNSDKTYKQLIQKKERLIQKKSRKEKCNIV